MGSSRAWQIPADFDKVMMTWELLLVLLPPPRLAELSALSLPVKGKMERVHLHVIALGAYLAQNLHGNSGVFSPRLSQTPLFPSLLPLLVFPGKKGRLQMCTCR